jgi:putative FmdB family regulatory protein
MGVFDCNGHWHYILWSPAVEEGPKVPIYEYQCSKCGEIFEAFQKISDDPLSQCKFCRGKVEKLISHSSFQLKGSGWYLTDYGNRTGSDSGSSSKSTPAKSE